MFRNVQILNAWRWQVPSTNSPRKVLSLDGPKSLYTKLPVLKVEHAGSLHFQWAKKRSCLRIYEFHVWELLHALQTDTPRKSKPLNPTVQPVRPVSKKWNKQECLGRIPTSKASVFLKLVTSLQKKTFFPLGKDQWRSPRHSLFIIGKKSWPRKRFSPTEPLGVAPGKTEPWNHGPAVLITSSSGNLQNISAWFSCETILWLGMIVWSLGIQSPNVRWWARGVLHHLQKRKVFRFHYHSQVRWLDP